MAAIIAVLLFPPSESLSSHVRTESRYGMKFSAALRLCAGADDAVASAEMTLPSVVRDLLMFAPSFRR
jgi:hypothetical protein